MTQKHIDAPLHVRGESKYVDDVAPPEGMLHACVVGSPIAHGRIRQVDYSKAAEVELAKVLQEHQLGRLANARNPLDLTPMADEQAYEGAVRVMLESDDVDALVVGVVPLTAALKTAALALKTCSVTKWGE